MTSKELIHTLDRFRGGMGELRSLAELCAAGAAGQTAWEGAREAAVTHCYWSSFAHRWADEGLATFKIEPIAHGRFPRRYFATRKAYELLGLDLPMPANGDSNVAAPPPHLTSPPRGERDNNRAPQLSLSPNRGEAR